MSVRPVTPGWASGRRAEGPVQKLDPDRNTQMRTNRAKSTRARPCGGGEAQHSVARVRNRPGDTTIAGQRSET